jgi:hypothetical protein
LGTGEALVRVYKRLLGVAGLALAAGLASSTTQWRATAADHLDPPTRTDAAVDTQPDIPADIADVYVWHTATDLVIAVTFAGPQPGNMPAFYDRDVLYTVNISNAGQPADPEVQIRFRFGKDAQNNAGVEITGLPDGGPALVGPVETTLTRSGILARAGLYDDPFFFDLQGFRDTRSTGNLAFNNQRSFFTGQNDTAMVLQIPRTLIDRGSELNVWFTTARFGGQL